MNKTKVTLSILVLIIAVLALSWDKIFPLLFIPRELSEETRKEIINGDEIDKDKSIEVIAENLSIPWEIATLPNGDLLVTQRPGTVLRIGQDKTTIPVNGVEHRGEGGLLGLALDPDFESNQFIYLYLTSRSENRLVNRVERYKLSENELTEREVVIDNIPGANYHDGGRIAFGPDGYLYITTGDAGNPNEAQNTNSLAGKILRIEKNGNIPDGNPFGNEVYSYGHRNPQGLAWDYANRLWVSEHGPSGIGSGYDEINLIRAGENYGWPEIKGEETKSGMTTPMIQSGADDTWAPADILFADGAIYFGGLRGETLYRAEVIDNKLDKLERYFFGEYGRIRAVVLGNERNILISTSNTDGRGNPNPGDDKIISIPLDLFD